MKNTQITQSYIKEKIRTIKMDDGITIINLSMKTNISMFCLVNILFNPFYKIKMTQGVSIARALGFKTADLLDIPTDIQHMELF